MVTDLLSWYSPGALWGGAIAVYLFLGGVGAGAYIIAAFADILGEKYKDISRFGAYISPIALIVGSGLLLLDLANPLRGLILPIAFVNPTSWMAIGAWLLLIGIILGLIYAYSWKANKSRRSRLIIGIIGIPIGIAIGTYTGLLLKATQFVPLWQTNLIPTLFVTSAMATGAAAACAVALIPRLSEQTQEKLLAIRKFSIIISILIVIEIVDLVSYVSTMKGLGGAALESINIVTEGSLSLAFWGGAIAIGLIVPLTLFILSAFAKKDSKIPLLGFSFVLIGGLILRFVIIYGAIKPFIIPSYIP